MEGNGKSFPYQNVWKVSSTTGANDQSTISHILSPLDSDKHLDRQSRFLLELLQTLQQVGLTNTSDRVTTERCNAILNQLAATPQSRSSKRNKSRPSNNNIESVVDHWQRIERAKTILDAMETYKDLEQSLRGQIPTDLPCPSHDSYFAVLRLYGAAKQVSQKELDSIVTDKTITNENLVLLQNANEAPLAAKAIVETMEASGKLALLPTSLHWNQVLSCYANAVRRPNRPLEAATLLYDLLQHESLVVDAFSFAHVLRACSDATALEEYYERSKDAVESSEFRKEKESFAKLALAVSKRVWNGLQQQQQQEQKGESNSSAEEPMDTAPSTTTAIDMNSHHFVHMLKAARNFATLIVLGDNAEHEQLRQDHHEWMRSIFEECCRHQKVNIFVVQEILYQGAILAVDSNTSNQHQELFEWVHDILVSSETDNSTSVDLARFRGRWDSDILPKVLKLQQQQQQQQEATSSMQLIYAKTREQTRILFKYVPSRWRAKADRD